MADSSTQASIDSAELARCLFEESSDGMFVFNPKSLQLIDVNPHAQQLTGLPRRELLDLTLTELFDAEDLNRLSEFFESCQVTQLFHSREAYSLMREGAEPLDVNVTVSRLHTKPNVLGVVAVRNVSERRQLEAEPRNTKELLEATLRDQTAHLQATTTQLQTREQQMRELLNDIDAIVWEAELPSWQFTYVSQQAESILGYPVSQWLSEPDFWVNHIHPDDVKRAVDVCRDSTERAADHDFDYRAIASDGRVIWLRDIVHVVKDEDGKPVKLRGVMFDITIRVESDQFHAHLAAIIESTADAIISANVDLVIQSWNPGAEHLLGYSANEMIGTNFLALVAAERLSETRSVISRVLHGETIREYETTRQKKNGELVDVSVTVAPTLDNDGRVVAVSAVIRDITKSKKSLESLRLRNQAIASATTGIVIMDAVEADLPIVFCNPAFQRITGYSFAELEGENCQFLQREDSDQPGVAELKAAISEQRECTAVVRNYRKNGDLFWNEVSIAPVCDASGIVTHLVCFQTDVTARIKMQQQIKESESRFRTVFDHAGVGVAFIDTRTGRFVRANGMYSNIVGYSAVELANLTFMEITYGEDLKEDLDNMQRLHNCEISTFQMQKRLIHKDGHLCWVNLTVSSTWQPEEEPLFHVAIVEDITARKSAEKQLLNYGRQQSAIAALGVFALQNSDVDEVFKRAVHLLIDTVDVEMAKVLELSSNGEHFLLRAGVGWTDGLTGTANVPNSVESQAGFTLLNSRPVVVKNLLLESRFSGPDLLIDQGVLSGISVIIHGVEHPYGVLGIHSTEVRDFTADEVNFVQAIANVVANAIARARSDERLRKSERQLAHVSRLSTMGEMVAGIAHEINQPLSAISNFASAAQFKLKNSQHEFDVPLGEWMELIGGQAVRCGDIIRRLRHFTRKDSSDKTHVLLESVIQDAVAILSDVIREHSVNVEWQLPDPDLFLMVNETELQQVLVNLLRNACDATVEAGIEQPFIHITATVSDDQVCLSIQDNGPGVADEIRDSLFEPFSTSRPNGMGMGLAISRSIVENHGGRLSIDDDVTAGARFRIELPNPPVRDRDQNVD